MKTKSTLNSLAFVGLVTESTTVKWPILKFKKANL